MNKNKDLEKYTNVWMTDGKKVVSNLTDELQTLNIKINEYTEVIRLRNEIAAAKEHLLRLKKVVHENESKTKKIKSEGLFSQR